MISTMPHALPRHLLRETTRHGATVYYVRRDHGPRVRIRADYGTEAFWREYRAALEGTAPKAKPKPKPGGKTLAATLEKYRESSAWRQLSGLARREPRCP